MPGFLCRDYFVNPNDHWRIALPQNLEEYYKNVKYKTRKNLRRTIKLLSEKNVSPVSIQCFRTVRDLDRFMVQAEAIAGKTYQRGLGAGFSDDGENRRLLTLAAERGWLRSYILYIGDQPISFDTPSTMETHSICRTAATTRSTGNMNRGPICFCAIWRISARIPPYDMSISVTAMPNTNRIFAMKAGRKPPFTCLHPILRG